MMQRDTIFSPSFGNRPAYLVGREQIIDMFLRGLKSESGNRDRAVVMLGQRGSGKTVLLWELADRATELGYVVATPTVVSDGMLERIVEKVQDAGERAVGESAAHLSGASVGAFGFSVGLEFTREVNDTKTPAYKLTKLARRLTEQGLGVLILIDELQANSEDVRRLVTVYQELVGERLNIAMVMAGLPGAVSEVLNDRALTFLNRARRVTLPPLARGDVDAFFARAFTQLDIEIDDAKRAAAVAATQGSPYLLQLIGHHIVLRADDEGRVSSKALADAIAASEADFESDVCRTTLAALSDRDVDFLVCMAQDDRESRISVIAERMGVSDDYAQKYRRRLIDAGVIEPVRRGYVRFAVPYLDTYLRAYDER